MRKTLFRWSVCSGQRWSICSGQGWSVYTGERWSISPAFPEKDYLNNIITYQYDELGRQTQRSTTFGDQLNTLFAWESISGSPRYSIQSSGNDGSLKKDYYDRLERNVQSDLKGFSGSMISTLTQYNALGQLYRISEPGSSTDWNVYSYNLYGQISGITRPSGRNSTWTYSGATATETTGGKSFGKTYNSAGLLMTATDNGGSISYSYLPNGATKTITAPGNIITRIKYDYADNKIKLIDPSAGTILYSYNAFKELIRQENNRNQVTTIVYYNDGRINHKDTPEAIATYKYNSSKNLVRIKLSTGINKIFKYDSKGRIISHCDSIGNVVLRDSITYDNLGRVLTIKHPSNIIESKYYNSSGYPDHVDAGGSTRWRINNMNSRLQIGSATYGSNLSETYTYDTYGYLTQVYTMNGMATIRDSRYSFNPVTQNLNWRKNALPGVNKQENFYYDNLDRLDSIRQGTITTLDLAYEPNKGGLIRKTDIGTLNYNLSSKPYALSSINPSTGIIPSAMNDSLSYTSFETVNVILEDIYKATFTYNCDNQRAKMVILKNNLPHITRWYFGNSYMREDSCGVIREYTYIAGNGYNAPVFTKKQAGIVTYYYLLRDHLGSITHVLNSINAVLKEYSYDAWGRMRNPTTWTICAPGSEPYLFGGRGYTGHEHLPWFKLINMNGRVYDPLTAQFLSVDNYVQNASYTQNFNRFGYCFNNPLKYTDPTGYYSYPVDQENRRGPLGPDKEFADLDLYGNAISNSGLGSGYRKSMIANCPHISEWKSQQYHYDYYWGRYVNMFGEEVDYNTALHANLRSYGGINITDPLAIMKFVLNKIIYPEWYEKSLRNAQKPKIIKRPLTDYDYNLTASIDGSGGDGSQGGNAFSWSVTLAIGPVGFTTEVGIVGDNNNGANTFFTFGRVYGWEASFQFNYYWIFGDFKAADWAGEGIYGDIGKGRLALGGSANRDFYSGEEYFPVSYKALKVSYGPAYGFGSFGRTTTVIGKIDIVKYILYIPADVDHHSGAC